MRWGIRLVCAVLLAGLSIGHSRAAEPIRFGAILPLTGPGAVVGTQEQRGIQFAIDEANAKGGVDGHQIEVLFEDNQAKPDQSILSFNKLVDLQHVPVIFTGYSGPSLAMAPLATRKKILMINAGAPRKHGMAPNTKRVFYVKYVAAPIFLDILARRPDVQVDRLENACLIGFGPVSPGCRLRQTTSRSAVARRDSALSGSREPHPLSAGGAEREGPIAQRWEGEVGRAAGNAA